MQQYRPPQSIPPVVKNLIIANAIVFLAQYVFKNQEIPLEYYGALWPLDSGYFKIWQLITHMFMHDTNNFFHLFFNMFGLFMFGGKLEYFWGPKRFFQFYMICGVVAGISQLLLGSGPAIGASGAVMGVLAGYAFLFPNTELIVLFIPIPVKAKYAIPGLMAVDLFGGIAQLEGDQIAHWAHLGGALTGLALVYFWNKKNRRNFY